MLLTRWQTYPARYISNAAQPNPLMPMMEGRLFGRLGEQFEATGKTAGPDIPPVPLARIGFSELEGQRHTDSRVLIMVKPLAPAFAV